MHTYNDRRRFARRIQRYLIAFQAAGLLAAFSGCGQTHDWLMVQSREHHPLIYVANESSNSVSVVDTGTYEVIGTIDTKNHGTHDLALSRDGQLLLATNQASGRLSIIDTTSRETLASIYTGNRCHMVVLTNDHSQAWVTNIGDDTISIVDLESFRIVGAIAGGKGPMGIAFAEDGHYAYVSNHGDKTVSVIDTASHRIVKSIPVGPNPHFLTLGPDGRIWGTNADGNDIYIIDPATQEKVASFEVGDRPQQIAFGYRGSQGPFAFVTIGAAKKVVAVNADIKNLKAVEDIFVGEAPNGIWANPEGTRLYVGHERSNDVRVIDTGTSHVIETVEVGRKPIRVVVSR
jgi:YVTN family beta-propeller protein